MCRSLVREDSLCLTESLMTLTNVLEGKLAKGTNDFPSFHRPPVCKWDEMEGGSYWSQRTVSSLTRRSQMAIATTGCSHTASHFVFTSCLWTLGWPPDKPHTHISVPLTSIFISGTPLTLEERISFFIQLFLYIDKKMKDLSIARLKDSKRHIQP